MMVPMIVLLAIYGLGPMRQTARQVKKRFLQGSHIRVTVIYYLINRMECIKTKQVLF